MISEDLKQQAIRYQKSRSFALNNMLKKELSSWLLSYKGTVLNEKCGTCVRNAMNDLVYAMQEEKAQEIKPAKIQFIGVKQYDFESMSYNDLKKEAKSRGIKMDQAPTKENLITALTNNESHE